MPRRRRQRGGGGGPRGPAVVVVRLAAPSHAFLRRPWAEAARSNDWGVGDIQKLLSALATAGSYQFFMAEATALERALHTLHPAVLLDDEELEELMIHDCLLEGLLAATRQGVALFMQLWRAQPGGGPPPDEGGPSRSLYSPLAMLCKALMSAGLRLANATGSMQDREPCIDAAQMSGILPVLDDAFTTVAATLERELARGDALTVLAAHPSSHPGLTVRFAKMLRGVWYKVAQMWYHPSPALAISRLSAALLAASQLSAACVDSAASWEAAVQAAAEAHEPAVRRARHDLELLRISDGWLQARDGAVAAGPFIARCVAAGVIVPRAFDPSAPLDAAARRRLLQRASPDMQRLLLAHTAVALLQLHNEQRGAAPSSLSWLVAAVPPHHQALLQAMQLQGLFDKPRMVLWAPYNDRNACVAEWLTSAATLSGALLAASRSSSAGGSAVERAAAASLLLPAAWCSPLLLALVELQLLLDVACVYSSSLQYMRVVWQVLAQHDAAGTALAAAASAVLPALLQLAGPAVLHQPGVSERVRVLLSSVVLEVLAAAADADVAAAMSCRPERACGVLEAAVRAGSAGGGSVTTQLQAVARIAAWSASAAAAQGGGQQMGQPVWSLLLSCLKLIMQSTKQAVAGSSVQLQLDATTAIVSAATLVAASLSGNAGASSSSSSSCISSSAAGPQAWLVLLGRGLVAYGQALASSSSDAGDAAEVGALLAGHAAQLAAGVAALGGQPLLTQVEELAPLQQQLERAAAAAAWPAGPDDGAQEGGPQQGGALSGGQTLAQLAQQLQQAGAAVCTQLPLASCCNAAGCVSLAGASEQALLGATSRCSLCKLARFCSPECQKAAWPLHKPVCKRLHRQASRPSDATPLQQDTPDASQGMQCVCS